MLQVCAEPRRMYPRAPQAFVGVDVPDSAQDVLIEKQRLDPGAAGMQLGYKFLLRCLERVDAEIAEDHLSCNVRQNPDASKPTDIGVPQLAAIIEREKQMRV